MEENSEEKPAQAVGSYYRFEYIGDDTRIEDAIPRYFCQTCGALVGLSQHESHFRYHDNRGDNDN